MVCNPRYNALLKHGNKSDRIDARQLADLLRLNVLEPVYHGETVVRMLRELARSYLTIVEDLSRAMNHLKALYRKAGMERSKFCTNPPNKSLTPAYSKLDSPLQ